MRTHRRFAASMVFLVAVMGLVAGACSSDEPSSTVSDQQECAAVAALKDSVTALTEIQAVAGRSHGAPGRGRPGEG